MTVTDGNQRALDLIAELKREITDDMVLEEAIGLLGEARRLAQERLEAINQVKAAEASQGAERLHKAMMRASRPEPTIPKSEKTQAPETETGRKKYTFRVYDWDCPVCGRLKLTSPEARKHIKQPGHTLTQRTSTAKEEDVPQNLQVKPMRRRVLSEKVVEGYTMIFVEQLRGKIPAKASRCKECKAIIMDSELLMKCPKCGGKLTS
jgi:rubrerythrin